jgi:hypothetical protein
MALDYGWHGPPSIEMPSFAEAGDFLRVLLYHGVCGDPLFASRIRLVPDFVNPLVLERASFPPNLSLLIAAWAVRLQFLVQLF